MWSLMTQASATSKTILHGTTFNDNTEPMKFRVASFALRVVVKNCRVVANNVERRKKYLYGRQKRLSTFSTSSLN